MVSLGRYCGHFLAAFGGYIVRTPQQLDYVPLMLSQVDNREQAAPKPGKIKMSYLMSEQEARPHNGQQSLLTDPTLHPSLTLFILC